MDGASSFLGATLRGMNEPYVTPWPRVAEAQEHARLWATARELLPDLADAQVAKVVGLVLGTCGVCKDAPVTCRCWDDE